MLSMRDTLRQLRGARFRRASEASYTRATCNASFDRMLTSLTPSALDAHAYVSSYELHLLRDMCCCLKALSSALHLLLMVQEQGSGQDDNEDLAVLVAWQTGSSESTRAAGPVTPPSSRTGSRLAAYSALPDATGDADLPLSLSDSASRRQTALLPPRGASLGFRG